MIEEYNWNNISES